MEEPPRILAELCTEENWKRLERASDRVPSWHLFRDIVCDLPEPRAYLALPFAREFPGGPKEWMWSQGQEILSAELLAHGLSLIDPDSIRRLVVFNRHLKKNGNRNIFLKQLIQEGCLSELYIPDLKEESVQRDEIFKIADLFSVKIAFWYPHMVAIQYCSVCQYLRRPCALCRYLETSL